jgi:hypothetical protein
MSGRVFEAASWYRIKVGKDAGKVGQFVGDIAIAESKDVILTLDFVGAENRPRELDWQLGSTEHVPADDVEFFRDNA